MHFSWLCSLFTDYVHADERLISVLLDIDHWCVLVTQVLTPQSSHILTVLSWCAPVVMMRRVCLSSGCCLGVVISRSQDNSVVDAGSLQSRLHLGCSVWTDSPDTHSPPEAETGSCDSLQQLAPAVTTLLLPAF